MVRKKRTRKPLDNEDIDDMDDIEDVDMDAVTDSEEEYTETEKKLLEKVRKQRTTENFDSDDEVYGLQGDSEVEEEDDERDSMESDIEGAQEDYDMPNDRAWGTKAKAFYSSDFKYTDYASAPEKDLVNADMEEEEGRRLHLRSMGQHLALDGSSFSNNKAAQVIEDSKVRKDSTQLSDKEFFMIMVKLFKDYMTQAKDILAPFLELVKDGTCPECNAVAFIRTKYEIILNYCTNISFLLMLQTKGLPVKSHPVVKRLAQYRHLISELESEQGDLLEQVAEILKAIKEGRPLYSISDGFQIQSSKKSPRLTSLSKKLASKKEAVTREEQSLSDSMDEEASIEDLDTEEKYDGESVADEKDTTILNSMNEKEEEAKRAITYQMAKNRGLTPYRKKELRNPRVKHRNKYRKAKIRRKGAVREVRKELTRYAGEISGIKAGVKKGIKLK